MSSKQQLVLGADAGTHGVRILAMDLSDCRVVTQSSWHYSRIQGEGVQELDALQLERAFFRALDALELPPESEIAALGITHQRGTMIPVDGSCRPLAPAFCDSDERALDAAGFAAQGVDPGAYYTHSGVPVVSFNGFSKILWVRQNQPELYRQTAAWLSPQDYLLSRLSGKLVISEGSALRSGFLDVRSRRVWTDLLPDAPFLKIPCVSVGGDWGPVDESWLHDYPVFRGARLIAVPGDQPAAYLGSGAAGKTMAMNLGTTFVASAAWDHVPEDPHGLITMEVLPGGSYTPEFGTGAGGQFMDFLTGLLGGMDSSDAWEVLDRAALDIPAGAQGLHIVPLLWQVTSAGIDGRMTGLRPFHTRAHFFRAAYEGLAYEARLSVERLSACTGAPDALRVFGGLSGCEGFLQILASVLGIPVEAAGQKQASAFGAALTCAYGLGMLADQAAISRGAGAPRCIKYPIEEERATYEHEFEAYRSRR